DDRTVSTCRRLFPPRAKIRVGGDVTHHLNLAGTDRCAAGTATSLDIGPGDVCVMQIPDFVSRPGYRANALIIILLGKAHPSHTVARDADDDAADLFE